MSIEDLSALWLTLKLALISTAILIAISTPLAWWLARARTRIAVVVESLIALPLVLPPTVLGFYLLIALGPAGIGQITQPMLGLSSLAFTFEGLIIGSCIYSLPFVVQPLQSGFNAISPIYLDAAATLRAGPLDRFLNVVLPLSKRFYISAATLGFAHTLGEFGVVLMIGGNIRDETRVVSIAIYEHVELLNYQPAHQLSLVLLLLALILLSLTYWINRSGFSLFKSGRSSQGLQG